LEVKKKFTIENKYNLASFISHIQDTLWEKKEKIITELELKLRKNPKQNYTDDLATGEKNKLKSDLSNYELNETKKKYNWIRRKSSEL
jgi:hypothetical protein